MRSLSAFAVQRVTGNTPTMYTRDNVCTDMECSVATSSQQAIKSCSGYDAALNKLKTACDSKNPKLVSNKNGDHNVCSVNGKVNATESWINGPELVDTGDCGHVSEEDQKIIGSKGCRSSSTSDLENYQSVFQKNCTTQPMDTFRGETLVNSSDVVNMPSNSVVSFEGSFSDFGSGNILMCGGEKTISTSRKSDMQEVYCSPEEQSDNNLCSFDFLSHESQDSEDPNLVGLLNTEVEPDYIAFTVQDLHILSSEENIILEGNDKSDSGDSVLHTSKDVLSAQSCNSTPHVVLMEDFPAKQREKCSESSDCFNKESQTVKLNDSNIFDDYKKCDLNVSENVDPCNAISVDKFEQSDVPTFNFALTRQDTHTVSEESERTRDLGSAPEPSDGGGNEAVRSSYFNVEPVMGGIDAKTDSSVEPLGFLGNPSMPEDAELLSNKVLLCDTEFNGKSASVNIDSSTQTSKMCISKASTTHMGLVESIYESSMSNHGVCMQDQNVMGNESEARTSMTINSHATDFCVELGNAKCVTSNKNDVVSAKRTEDGKNESYLSLIPPRNAVPFSDEWFAAIEAAGEDILTMKGGAVQNSPPDKSLPEPSPWSPVQRHNNVGPHDCTKIMRNMAGPSDS
ncbi:unnamed protein product [Cuscuta campestris]|uniref:Uncharacterized protein n=1 Tax=Cuscuta campestris TaxID=132261 RepID=A0A484LK01_9ASTE|nr:unnamed protein product [Cuscuta campestris]